MASNLKVDIVRPTATNGSLSLKGDSGGSATANGVTVDSSGNTAITGTTTVSQLNAADGAEATPSIANTGDTNTGIYFPAADTVGVSTGGSERMRIDSSGNVQLTGSLTAGTIGSGVVFPAGHIIQFAQSFTETSGVVIGNLSSVGSGSPATILTATINNVLASSKVFGFFYSGGMILNSGQYIANNVAGGSINMDYINQSGSGNTYLSPTFFFYDDAPGTGTNSYVLKGYSNASGNAAYWCGSGGRAYGWMLFEVAQ